MPTGKVIWYKPAFGYGFIEHEDGRHVFFHHTDIDSPGVDLSLLPDHYRNIDLSPIGATSKGKVKLRRNQELQYEVTVTKLGLRATKVKRV